MGIIYYKQCLLEKVKGKNIDTAWIPENFSIINKIIKIKINNVFEDWKVLKIFGRAEEDQLLAHERDYLHQRKMSDV
jgi:hypothetical protein